jgi:formamidopyrimidine-DNA glycosylase
VRTAIRRHGRQLLVARDDGHWLALHFGMTGRLFSFETLEDAPEHDRLRFGFADGGHLAFDDRQRQPS